MEGRECLSGLPGSDTCVDIKDEVTDPGWVSSVPVQWANGNAAMAGTPNGHHLQLL